MQRSARAVKIYMTVADASWVQNANPRVELRYGDAAKTGLEDATASLVSLSLVVHELSREGRREVSRTARYSSRLLVLAVTFFWRFEPGGALPCFSWLLVLFCVCDDVLGVLSWH